MIRVLVVDDEPLARERLRTLLAREADIEVVGEAGNGADAATQVMEQRPDLVFLDVQMPEVDGFGFLTLLNPTERPTIVFVTAFDEYALRAFDVHALDYLLKPFDRGRFLVALGRARESIADRRTGGAAERIEQLLAALPRERRPPDRLVARAEGRTVLIRPDEVDWIEAAANYVRVHRGRETFQLRGTLASLEASLDADRFMRIHRSTIVHVDRISHLEPYFHGDWIVTLTTGARLTLSRTYRERVEARLGRSL